MKRILLVGSPGAGKSTLARRLGAVLGLPVIHLDQLFHEPGWVERSHEDFDARLAEALAGDEWIIDGNYGRTAERRILAADTVVFLDVPRMTCMWRVLRRIWTWRGRTRPDLPEGCPERLDLKFLHWVWTYTTRSRAGMIATIERCREGRQVFVLRTTAEMEAFVADAG